MKTPRSVSPARRDERRVSRLGFVLALFTLALVAFVSPRGVAQPTSDGVHVYGDLRFDSPVGPMRIVVAFPRLPQRATHPPGSLWPVVVALHGLGEAEKGPERGSLGWSQEYRLPNAYKALLGGSLTPADFGGLVRPARLARLNAELAAHPFRGVAVVMPFTPSLLGASEGARLRAYEDWLAGPMLARVRETYPGIAHTAAGTGIDGVSLGGRIALETGFRHPEAFSAVGGIQPAVRGDVPLLAGLVDRSRGQRVRLLSSDDDPYPVPTRELSDALREKGIPHDLLVEPGSHGYEFNRGPGAIELLRFGEATLARESAAP